MLLIRSYSKIIQYNQIYKDYNALQMSKLFSDDYVVNRGYRKLNINQTRMTTSINNAADGRKVCITTDGFSEL